MDNSKENEEIQRLKEINSKQLSQIMSLQEKIEELLKNNISYNKELSDNSNKILELEHQVRELKEQNKEYNEFKQLFPDQNAEYMLREFKIQSEGNHQLFSDYENMRLELSDYAYKLSLLQLNGKDLDILSNTIALQNLCVVYIVKNGGGVTEIKNMYDTLYGKKSYNDKLAKNIYEQAKAII